MTMITITLSRNEAEHLAAAMSEIDRTHSYAAAAFSLLHERARLDACNEDHDAMAVMFLAQRALTAADENEAETLRCFSQKLRLAVEQQHIDVEGAR